MRILAVTGNTFPHRDLLKALGCRWQPERKVWSVGTAGMNGQAHYEFRSIEAAVREAITSGKLSGCRLEVVK
ncbi:MAG TPA: hypothetical protein VNI83_06050 [Vicinamibacterales bacterium]|nr:hypothetical protein [Vicinamibacterales bacterium]